MCFKQSISKYNGGTKMSWQVKAKDVKKLQVEITNYCQARCPECAREKIFTSGIDNSTPYVFEINNKYVTLEQFKGWVQNDEWSSLQLIDICGNYDEPCTNPELIDIVEWILQSKLFDQNLQVNIATNGGIRDTKFWTELGYITEKYRNKKGGPRLRVVWGIDGLEDTNHLYRRNVKWDKLQENFRAYIRANGNAYWQFIYFKHNEHQDEQVKERSIKEGFKGVKWRGAKSRPYEETQIEPAQMGKYEKPNVEASFEVKCKAIARLDYHGLDTGLYITHQGWLLPCCWWGTKSTMKEVYEKYGHKYDVRSHLLTGSNSIQDALDGEWFSNLHNEIIKDVFAQCSLHCKENVISTISTEINKNTEK
tara:strand:+ start:1371 stop:2465 length:1095 start_codon:yes stop_codon:yes gene_type:complete